MKQPPQWKRGLRDLAVRVEEEAVRSTAYVNDRIVPAMRREALHETAIELRQVAGRWEARLAAEQARV